MSITNLPQTVEIEQSSQTDIQQSKIYKNALFTLLLAAAQSSVDVYEIKSEINKPIPILKITVLFLFFLSASYLIIRGQEQYTIFKQSQQWLLIPFLAILVNTLWIISIDFLKQEYSKIIMLVLINTSFASHIEKQIIQYSYTALLLSIFIVISEINNASFRDIRFIIIMMLIVIFSISEFIYYRYKRGIKSYDPNHRSRQFSGVFDLEANKNAKKSRITQINLQSLKNFFYQVFSLLKYGVAILDLENKNLFFANKNMKLLFKNMKKIEIYNQLVKISDQIQKNAEKRKNQKIQQFINSIDIKDSAQKKKIQEGSNRFLSGESKQAPQSSRFQMTQKAKDEKEQSQQFEDMQEYFNNQIYQEIPVDDDNQRPEDIPYQINDFQAYFKYLYVMDRKDNIVEQVYMVLVYQPQQRKSLDKKQNSVKVGGDISYTENLENSEAVNKFYEIPQCSMNLKMFGLSKILFNSDKQIARNLNRVQSLINLLQNQSHHEKQIEIIENINFLNYSVQRLSKDVLFISRADELQQYSKQQHIIYDDQDVSVPIQSSIKFILEKYLESAKLKRIGFQLEFFQQKSHTTEINNKFQFLFSNLIDLSLTMAMNNQIMQIQVVDDNNRDEQQEIKVCSMNSVVTRAQLIIEVQKYQKDIFLHFQEIIEKYQASQSIFGKENQSLSASLRLDSIPISPVDQKNKPESLNFPEFESDVKLNQEDFNDDYSNQILSVLILSDHLNNGQGITLDLIDLNLNSNGNHSKCAQFSIKFHYTKTELIHESCNLSPEFEDAEHISLRFLAISLDQIPETKNLLFTNEEAIDEDKYLTNNTIHTSIMNSKKQDLDDKKDQRISFFQNLQTKTNIEVEQNDQSIDEGGQRQKNQERTDETETYIFTSNQSLLNPVYSSEKKYDFMKNQSLVRGPEDIRNTVDYQGIRVIVYSNFRADFLTLKCFFEHKAQELSFFEGSKSLVNRVQNLQDSAPNHIILFGFFSSYQDMINLIHQLHQLKIMKIQKIPYIIPILDKKSAIKFGQLPKSIIECISLPLNQKQVNRAINKYFLNSKKKQTI